jgi:two-component system chemotaxis response regulator CheB
MAKARIHIVDDSAETRRGLADPISADPDLEVDGEDSNGRIAPEHVAELSPNHIVLDVAVPELDGLSTLAQLRRTHPRLPVITFSALTVTE